MESERLEWLQGRIALYDVLRQLYLRPPTPEVLNIVRSLEVDPEGVPADLQEGFHLLQAAAGDGAPIQKLAAEYMRLFVGPGQVPVPPFESCYRTSSGLVMQEVTSQVRRAYLEAGLLVRRLHSDPDDHMAVEWEFLYALASKAVAALSRGDAAEADSWLARRRIFLQDHLLQWTRQFCERLLAATPSGFFRGLALFTQGVTEVESQDLADES